MDDDSTPHVFISYVREDMAQVDTLCQALTAAQIPYWRDREALGPGDQWKDQIRNAIRSGALVFIACFSKQSRAKAKSYMNEELTLAIEEFRMRPPDATWIIPVRLDDVEIPEWSISTGRTLLDLNYMDLFGTDLVTEMIKLTTKLNNLLNPDRTDAAMLQASIGDAAESQRAKMLRQATKDMILEPSRRIVLDGLISDEVRSVLREMRDTSRFPMQIGNATNDQIAISAAESAISYKRLSEAFLGTLQVAARWADAQTIQPWISGIRSLASESNSTANGQLALIKLKHIPTLGAVFAASMAAIGQHRWDNLKTLVVDLTVSDVYGLPEQQQPFILSEHPWSPFVDGGDIIPTMATRIVREQLSPSQALEAYSAGKLFKTPASEWLHIMMRPLFEDQYPDDDSFDAALIIPKLYWA